MLTDVRGHVSHALGQTAPPQTYTVTRSAACPQRNETPNNRPKPDSIAIAKRRSASHGIAAKPSTPPKSWSRLSMTWGIPHNLVIEIEGRLRRQQKLLRKIVGMMFPPLFGCRTNTELCRVRGWDKHLPSRLLGALPKRSWIKRLRRLGVDVLVPLWRYAASKSEATRSRWQWTWVADDSVFKKYGEQ